MQAAASTGLRFQRMKGRSVLYTTPSTALPTRVASSAPLLMATPATRDAAPHAATMVRPCPHT